MNNELRLEYLSAMGVEVWIPKSSITIAENPLLNTTPVQSAPIIESGVKADTWEQLSSDINGCERCDLCQTRTQSIVGSGSRQADWMWIIDVPSIDEDNAGEPMVGNVGHLYTEMLRAIGLSREEVYTTHIIKCATPNHRSPHKDELKNCHEYIVRQQNLIKPKIIIAVGHVAAQTLLNNHEPLEKLRGQHLLNNTPLVVMNHPAYLLRFLPEKNTAWQDLLKALQLYKKLKN